MNKDLLNILSNSNKDIDNQKLMDYLAGKLPDAEKNEVERWMAEQPEFGNDAMEGLSEFSKGTDLNQYVESLNKDLNKLLKDKKARREKRKLKDQPWVYITLITILVLAVAAFYVIRKMLER